MFNNFWRATGDKDNPGLIEIIEKNASEFFDEGAIGFAEANFTQELDKESVSNFSNWNRFDKLLQLEEAKPFKK